MVGFLSHAVSLISPESETPEKDGTVPRVEPRVTVCRGQALGILQDRSYSPGTEII
jgi:hypothetical protein